MQIIIVINGKLEKYVENQAHTQVRPPGHCPWCDRDGGLKAHSYYFRNTTASHGRAIRIGIRRFRCRRCGKTVSCLPSFVQPYRYVSTLTIQRFFAGRTKYPDVQRNKDLLQRYWNRFQKWSYRLWFIIGGRAIARQSLVDTANALWKQLFTVWQNLATCTHRLVADFQATCFGQYLCHQRRTTLHTTCPYR